MYRAGGRRGVFLFANLAALFAAILLMLSISNPAAAEGTPPQISAIQAAGITSTIATITWTTDIPSDSAVFYQLMQFGAVMEMKTVAESAITHSISLASLQPDSNYSYFVGSCDANGCSNSSAMEFTTLPGADASPTPTPNPSPTIPPTPTPVPNPSPSVSPTPTEIPSPTATFSPSPNATQSPTPTLNASITPTPVFSPTPSTTVQPSPKIDQKSFDRRLDCPKCGQHKAPPLTNVEIALIVSLPTPHTGATLTDTFPSDWQVVDSAGGIVTEAEAGFKKISWNFPTVEGTISKTYVLRSPERTIPPTKYDFKSRFESLEGFGDDGGYFIILSDPVAQPGAPIELRAQACAAANGETDSPDVFQSACDGSYPSNSCSAGNDLVDCDDGSNYEQVTGTQWNYVGINTTYYNTTINDCGTIDSVKACYEWWKTTSITLSDCHLSIDTSPFDSFEYWSDFSTTCPGTSAPGITCTDVTSSNVRGCRDFFGVGSAFRPKMRLAAWQTGSGTATVRIDVLFYNVTYSTNECTNLTSSTKYTNDINVSTVNSAGTCMNITTNGVILDCSGFNITGNGGNGISAGVNISYASNVVVKNCVFVNFTYGIFANNADNLTLLNNTFINISDYGVYAKNSWGSNISQQYMRDFVANDTTTGAHNITGMYFENFSNSAISTIHMNRLRAGNNSHALNPGGSAYGIILTKAHNNTISHILMEKLWAGRGRNASSSGGGPRGSNVTGIYIAISNNSILSNITLSNLNASDGSWGISSSSPQQGGAGGEVFGMYLYNAYNTTVNNLTARNITSGAGGWGGDKTSGSGGGGAGGIGGMANIILLQVSENNTLNTLVLQNSSGNVGGHGGNRLTSGNGGAGGKGGFIQGILLFSSSNTTIINADIRNIDGGRGGAPGSGGTPSSYGIGGDAQSIYISKSNYVNLTTAFINHTMGGGAGQGSLSSAGAAAGLYISASNYTSANLVAVLNISSSAINDMNYAQHAALYLTGSSQGNFTNSSFALVYVLTSDLPYPSNQGASIYSESYSVNNRFVNVSFNKSDNGWSGIANFTAFWYVRANVSDAAYNLLSNVLVNTTNATNREAIWKQPLTTSGFTAYFEAAEYRANGSYTYYGNCTNSNTLQCYTPYNFTTIIDNFKQGTNFTNITGNMVVIIQLPAEDAPTQNNPIFSPSPPDYLLNLTCLNQSTADADSDPVFNIYDWRFNASGGKANESAVLYLPFDTEVLVGGLTADYSPRNGSAYLGSGSARPTWFRYNNVSYGSSALGGGAYYFDGGDTISVASTEAPYLNATNNLTLMGWVNQSDYTSSGYWLMDARAGNNGFGIMLGDDLGLKDNIYCGIGNSSQINSVTYQPSQGTHQGKLTFIACTYNTTSAILYVNGSEVKRTNLVAPSKMILSSAVNLSIGSYVTGSIDEVRIYNATLSPEQIDFMYNQRFFNGTVSQEMGANMNVSCCITPTDTYRDGATKCVSDLAVTSASTSFTVFTLGGGGNQTSSFTSLMNFTESYFFNSTNRWAELVPPCAGADGTTNCQTGMALPAFRVRNTGTSNNTIWLNISSSLSAASIQLCANSSAPSGCGTGVVGTCAFTGEGNLNASAWLKIISNLGTNSVCYDANITVYANFSAPVVGTPVSRVLAVNST